MLLQLQQQLLLVLVQVAQLQVGMMVLPVLWQLLVLVGQWLLLKELRPSQPQPWLLVLVLLVPDETVMLLLQVLVLVVLLLLTLLSGPGLQSLRVPAPVPALDAPVLWMHFAWPTQLPALIQVHQACGL